MLQTKGLLEYSQPHMGNPCDEYLSDIDFLKHMIPHHQVAIDMSKKIMNISKDPTVLYLARNIRYKQTDEILFMENLLLSRIPNLSSKDKDKKEMCQTFFKIYYPELSSDKKAKCGKAFFDPHEMHHDPSMKLTDKMFLEHMIPHHQIAVDMSRRLLKHTNNPSMTQFAYEIIKAQEYEIFLMKQLLQSSKYPTDLISYCF